MGNQTSRNGNAAAAGHRNSNASPPNHPSHDNRHPQRQSRHHNAKIPIRHNLLLRRTKGRLGLTTEELDLRCRPSGLYPTCPHAWDTRQIRRLISDGKLASRLIGSDHRICPTDQECPICFLHYSEINTADCCKAAICTECFLQVQDPKRSHSCPFCNGEGMTVGMAKRLEEGDVMERQVEEQKFIEASIREKFGGGDGGNTGDLDLDLESRSRSRTLSSEDWDIHETMVVMSPEERKRLEEEMKSQSHHPLVRQMSAQAERERERHELEYIQRRLWLEENHPARRGVGTGGGGLAGGGLVGTGSSGSSSSMRNAWNDRRGNTIGEFGAGMHTGRGGERMTNHWWTNVVGPDLRDASRRRRGNRNRDEEREGLSVDDWIMLEAAFLLGMQNQDEILSMSRPRTRTTAATARSGSGSSPTSRDSARNNQQEEGWMNQRRRRPDDRPIHQREAESWVRNMIRDRALEREQEQEQRQQGAFQHGYPIGQHAYRTTAMSDDSFYGLLSEENQLEIAIRLSLLEAQQREERNNDSNGSGNDAGANENATTTTNHGNGPTSHENEDHDSQQPADNNQHSNDLDDYHDLAALDHGVEEIVFEHADDHS